MSLVAWLRRGLLVTVIALGAACGPFVAIPYEPQPARISDAKEEIKTIILATTTQGCMSNVEFSERIVAVKFACLAGSVGGVGNTVLRPNEIDHIELQQRGDWYRVLVHHRGGAAPFDWIARGLTDMQRLADAIAALARHAK
jgi:hypothetical protein